MKSVLNNDKMKCGQNVGVDTTRIALCNVRSIDCNERKLRDISDVCTIFYIISKLLEIPFSFLIMLCVLTS